MVRVDTDTGCELFIVEGQHLCRAAIWRTERQETREGRRWERTNGESRESSKCLLQMELQPQKGEEKIEIEPLLCNDRTLKADLYFGEN